MKYSAALFLLFIASFPIVALADLATSTNFRIERGVIDVGGNRATSTGFDLRSSIGQPGTGISSSTSFILRGGFLHFLAVTTTTATSSPPSGGGPSAGGGGVPTGGGGTGYFIGPPPVTVESVCGEKTPKSADLSHDDGVDIIDLSILLYYYSQSGPLSCPYDLNNSGIVDFPDISIMMFYWTD